MTDTDKPNSTPNQSIENIIGEKVFLFNGRYSQRKFWRWALLLPPLMILMLFPLASMSNPTGAGGAISLFVVAMPFLFLYVKLLAHRLHDIGWSGWYALLFIVLPFFMFWESTAIYARIEQTGAWTQPYSAFMTIGSLAIFFGGFIVMGCISGTKGPNQYGSDPGGETKPDAE